ncbi:hypothetical protein [Nakamurella endophytica]|uniref:Uncharacterized protein n=1 Tax=Nakamurella endophytica TaxID=1748367 RepID=A0A917WAR5_9ACTN|nr:hypothetical protein [Nakamurella endophytica]GGL86631.1 hypothetical protein GCM10011594_02790 [Nakamurella endophytica]
MDHGASAHRFGRRALAALRELTARLDRPDVRVRDLVAIWAAVVLVMIAAVAAVLLPLLWLLP